MWRLTTAQMVKMSGYCMLSPKWGICMDYSQPQYMGNIVEERTERMSGSHGENCCEILSSEDDTAVMLMNSQLL